ncbi:hypothetical protein ACFXDJ_27285 [Streptomyces sp. NPDC059443]|uniref:hypothetical protein n=1 Tax=unclassified Streptomyces TaxID=2593676 RepID=UPI00368DB57F
MSPGGSRWASPSGGWISLAPGAEVAFAAQFLFGGLFWTLTLGTHDDYDTGNGGVGGMLGLLCVGVFAPPVLYLYGWLQAWLFTVPVMMLSNAIGVRTRVPAPWWALPALLVVSAAYAVPLTLALGGPYVITCCAIAIVGVIPAGLAVCARMRQWPKAKVRKWLLIVTGAAVPLTIVGGIVGYTTGLIPAYRPPALVRADFVGEWSGEDGTRLVLGAGGEVTAQGLPVEQPTGDAGSCTGSGTWKDTAAIGDHRAGVSLTVPDCKRAELRWAVAGTAERPELFVMIGDDDDGVLRILRKR